MKPNMEIPTYLGWQFTWRKVSTSRTDGSAEASDLGIRPGELPGKRVWNDAVDVGFYVVSPRTGRKVLFTLQKEDIGDAGEVIAWAFVSEDNSVTIKIFND